MGIQKKLNKKLIKKSSLRMKNLKTIMMKKIQKKRKTVKANKSEAL